MPQDLVTQRGLPRPIFRDRRRLPRRSRPAADDCDNARAKIEILKHLDGDLRPSTTGGRGEINGRAKSNTPPEGSGGCLSTGGCAGHATTEINSPLFHGGPRLIWKSGENGPGNTVGTWESDSIFPEPDPSASEPTRDRQWRVSGHASPIGPLLSPLGTRRRGSQSPPRRCRA